MSHSADSRRPRRDHSIGSDVIFIEAGRINTHGAADFARDVDRVADYLGRCGLATGDRVGIRGPNSYEWLVLDLALISLGCVSVCLPQETSKLTSMSSRALMTQLCLRAMFQWDCNADAEEGSGVVNLRRILDADPPSVVLAAESGGQARLIESDIFTVVFSSGSTGRLKRLLLSWLNVQRNVEAFGDAFGLVPGDRVLIVMPLSSFQQRYLAYCAIRYGCDIVLACPESFLLSLRVGRPTVILGPPSFYELFETRFNRLPAWRRRAMLTLSAALDVFPETIRSSCCRQLFGSFHRLYGGVSRIMLIGSAPARRSTLDLCRAAGFPLFQCYGLTESGWIAWNRPGANKVGTVGMAAFAGTVQVAADGEILISRTWHQCARYEALDGETAEAGVFLDDNIVATGDLGSFDPDGYLTLSGRKKNIIVTSGGMKVSAEAIEAKLSALPMVSHAVVFAHPRLPVLAAAVWTVDDSAVSRRSMIPALMALNADALKQTPVLGVVFPDITLSIESGLLTRNLKIDRIGVRSAFQDGVKSLAAASTTSDSADQLTL